ESPLAGEPLPAANERLWYGRLASGAGYLAVLQMGGFAEDEEAGLADELAALDAGLDQALAALDGASAMIIDLRYNPGGDDAFGLAIANRFADRRRPAFSKQAFQRGELTPAYDVELEPAAGRRFAGPVAVLAGPLTTSAAEATCLMFRALPHARLVGAPTRGILSDALEKRLPNGWEFTLSNEIYRSPAGEAFEGAGVPPHVATAAGPPASVDERFGRDIRAAAALLAGD
ncbi:MAG TPA: S41 family peptidase, partial [Herpetosiphonaceae bacterium]